MNKEHVLIAVLGRTAAGKDSLVKMICDRTDAKALISYTTRERRTGEGNTHIFATEADYEQMLADGKIAAHTKIGQHYYWCTVEQLYEADYYVIDPLGLKTLKTLNLPDLRLVTLYVHVPDEVRQHRALTVRQDDKSKFRVRDFSEREQFREFERNLDFDYSIKNIDLVKSYSMLRWLSILEGVLTPDKLTKKDQGEQQYGEYYYLYFRHLYSLQAS